jgi:hypothetical protein
LRIELELSLNISFKAFFNDPSIDIERLFHADSN